MASTGHQLSLWARDLVAASSSGCSREEAQVDVSFLHRGFCIMGMPLRQPKDSLRPFSRHDGRFALTIEPASVTHPDGGLINIGVPFGPKARLIAMWMATEVQNPRRNTTDRILALRARLPQRKTSSCAWHFRPLQWCCEGPIAKNCSNGNPLSSPGSLAAMTSRFTAPGKCHKWLGHA